MERLTKPQAALYASAFKPKPSEPVQTDKPTKIPRKNELDAEK